MGDSVLRWEFDNATGVEDEVLIWRDMDFSCKRRNLCTDIERVVAIAKRFFESGSYEALGDVNASAS
jgi:hypothetical protein